MNNETKTVIVDENGKAKESKLENAKRKAKKFAKAAWDNRQYVIPLVVTGVSAAVSIGQMVQKRGNVKAEAKLKDNYIYDRSCGHYVESKRKISSQEWLQIDQRHENGENYSEILDDMGLLKR